MASGQPRYDWKRFYYPVGKELTLWNGFLLNPDGEHGECYNPGLVSSEKLFETQCVVILGEQGIGKSTVFQQEEQLAPADPMFLRIDTGSVGSEDRLEKLIFQDPVFQEWLSGTRALDLFLDSFDEGPLDIHLKATLLAAELRRYPIDRLRLRIACRTADWPSSLGSDLKKLWGDGFQVYGLAPLRQEDAEQAARVDGIDPEAFLREINEKSVGALASKPLSLKMLLKQYQKHGSLPSSQIELMHEGLLRLCEEVTDARRAHERLSSNQRLVAAGRIAAITVFAAKPAIWIGSDSMQCPDNGCATIQDICGGTELTNGEGFAIDGRTVREALNTGLFRPHSNASIYWGHQTYAEYLAAWYVTQREATKEQIRAVLLHPTGSLVPRLRGVAAWLAEFNPGLFDILLEADPESLLLADLTRASDSEKAALVQALLDLYERPGSFPRDRYPYKALAHPGLSDIIGDCLRSPATTEGAKYLALGIAEDCRLHPLADDLLAVAVDPVQPAHMRSRAVAAIAASCSPDVRSRLKPLAAASIANDPDDEIKGACLRAIWPGCLSLEELLAMLAPPKSSSHFGAYWGFLSYDLLKNVRPPDLAMVLEWTRQQPPRHEAHWFDKLMAKFITLAWDNVDTPGVPKNLARALVARKKLHEDIEVPEDDDRRRRILPDVIAAAVEEGIDPFLLCYSRPLVRRQDLPLLISWLESESSENVQAFLAKLISRVADEYTPSDLDAVLEACKSNRFLEQECIGILTPVRLDSDPARQMQETYRTQLEWAERSQQREHGPHKDKGPSPARLLKRHIRDGKKGGLDAWWQINWVLRFLEDGSATHNSEVEADLTKLPGWENADERTRSEIVTLAQRYVASGDPRTDEWLPDIWIVNYQPAYAGYRALHLLCKEEPGELLCLPDELWRRWAPAVVAGVDADSTDVGGKLLVAAHRHAPADTASALVTLLSNRWRTILRSTKDIWDDTIAQALAQKCRDRDLQVDCLRELLAVLLKHDCPEIKQYAGSLVSEWCSSDPDQREKAVVAAQSLMLHSPDAGWNVVWPVVEQDNDFGKRIIDHLIHMDHSGNEADAAHMTPDQLVSLYIWVERHYPNEVHHFGWGAVGPADERYWWKGGITGRLTKAGAIEAVARLREELPELDWMEMVLTETRKVSLERTWMPPTPKELMQLISNSRTRLVQTEEQLLEVVLESMARLQMRLRGETRQLFLLWDDDLDNGKCKPKKENRISDYVTDHLRNDLTKSGIILSREVEIRARCGSLDGEETDILVKTTARDGPTDRKVVSVVIEVKGNWHKELYTAMESQLVNRYLKENQCQCGLYLVGWFDSPSWDDSNARRARKKSLAEARTLLEDKASELSGGGRCIRAYVLNASW